MRSVPITTNVMNSNPTQARCTRYDIMWWSLSVTCGKSGSLRFSQFSGCWLILCLYTYEFWLSLWKIVRSSVILLLPLFCPCTLISSTNKTDRHDITEILLKVALNTINKPTNQTIYIKTDECHISSKSKLRKVIFTSCDRRLSTTTPYLNKKNHLKNTSWMY